MIFRDPKTDFNYLDKNVLEMVADDDILTYQERLKVVVGGRGHEIHEDVYFIQPFFTSIGDVNYFARKYKPWANTAASC